MWPSVVVGVALWDSIRAAWGAAVLKVRDQDRGTVVFENLPEQAIVTVDGNDCTVEWPAGQRRGSRNSRSPPENTTFKSRSMGLSYPAKR